MTTATLMLLSVLVRPAAAEKIKLPDGAVFLLPTHPGVHAEWPVHPGTLKKLQATKLAFGVAGTGKICLIAGGKVFFYPEVALSMYSKVRTQDVIFLDAGNMIVRYGQEVGTLETNPDRASESPEEQKKGNLIFKPFIKLPYKDFKIFTGIGKYFYVVGRNEEKNRNELSLWNLDHFGPVSQLMATDGPITAVAGTPDKTYYALERGVLLLEKGAKEAKAVFVHPREDIKSLIYRPDVGLFYTTENAAGYIGEKAQFDFLVYPGTELRLGGKDLYVRLGSVANGIMRIKGPEHYASIRQDDLK